MEDQGPERFAGLPWPEEYAGLRPLIQREWGASEDIYLLHKLSGKSGAQVYAADVHCRDFSGQAILKFDKAPDPAWGEKPEVERHQDAAGAAPDFAARHFSQIVHTLNDAKQVAILSTIAARGLEYAKPWAECSHAEQLDVVQDLCRGLLEDWNPSYRVERGLVSPRDLLKSWLRYRLDPGEGRLHGFLSEACGVPPDIPTIMFEGHWYPNPLAFAITPNEEVDRRHQRPIRGNIHGDLHGFNVLVSREKNERPWYYLIDFGLYQDDQYLFYDHAYFELSHLLMSRDRADEANWRSLLRRMSKFDRTGAYSDVRGDDLGLLEIVFAIRREVAEWTDRHEANRLAYMEGQYALARVAVGLNFANKPLSDKARRMAYIYAASNLKDFLKLNKLGWERHGPPMGLDGPVRRLDHPGGSGGEPPGFPDRPAIAVLAFENQTGDPEREYVSDGFTNEIIHALSRLDWLMIISRGSTFRYKNTTTDLARISSELGVHYVVEGGVRIAGDRVRVSVQLVNALNSHHLWTERYDRALSNLFELEEEIAEAIAANVDSTLRRAERQRARTVGNRVSTWLSYQHALWTFLHAPEKGEAEARAEFERIAEAEPAFAEAPALLSIIDTRPVLVFETDDPGPLLKAATREAERAVGLDDASSIPRIALCRALMLSGKADAALAEARLAVEANPSSTVAQLHLAGAYVWAGDAGEAAPIIDRMNRLSPKGLFPSLRHSFTGFTAYLNDDLDGAIEGLRSISRDKISGPVAPIFLAAVSVRAGRSDAARRAIAELHAGWPDLTRARVGVCWAGLDARYLNMLLSDLEAAGLPA